MIIKVQRVYANRRMSGPGSLLFSILIKALRQPEISSKSGFFAVYMSLSITSLNSGSNGNCYYVGNEQEAVLVDAGISCREIERRMKRLGPSMQKVKAVFISHEHSDHIRGLAT